jgi:ComEC/Rec2-related protein
MQKQELQLRTPALKPLTPAFNATGTAHLIAPSGFKVTVLAGLVIASTRWLYEGKNARNTPSLPAQKRNWRRWAASALVISSVAIYTILSGAGPAALRAGLMGILLVVAPRFGRIYNLYTALAASVLLMSIFDPFVLWDAGFLLSFLGTLGIVLLTPFFQKWLKPLERLPFGHTIAEMSAVTLAAQMATLPIIALTFNQVSFIAPIANVLTVPLLGVLIFTGLLICGAGSLFAPLGLLCGWLAWPLLWYVSNIVRWCAMLPGAFMSVTNLNSELAWAYYGLLALLVCIIHYKWPQQKPSLQSKAASPLSQRRWHILQLSAAVLVIFATGATALAARPDGRLTITFLNVGPANQPSQGEALLLHTPDGKNALIDGGLDATSLGQELDSRLPSWQRSLDMVILTSPKSDHLLGLQDVVSRYQVGEVVDGGMLHPNVAYALWRRTIAERNIPYLQARQGAIISIGSQVSLQVFWPRPILHKSSNEEVENGLVIRLIAPGLRLLLLGATALSKYALTGLLNDIAPSYLQADIVQAVAEVGKVVPTELGAVLQAAHPSLLVITPAALSAKLRKAGMATSALNPLPQLLAGATWQTEQTALVGTIEVHTSNQGWGMNV